MIVDLKQIDSLIILQQTGFLWEHQRIAIQDMESCGEPRVSPENKGVTHSFIEERGSSEELLQTESIGGNRKFEVQWLFIGGAVTAFRWQSGYQVRRSSSLLLEQNRENAFLVRRESKSLPVGVCEREW